MVIKPEVFFADLCNRVGSAVAARLPATDRCYDDVISGVLYRLVRHYHSIDGCVNQGVNLDHYVNACVRDSWIDVARRDRALAFKDEMPEFALPESDVTVDDILDVIRKKATTRQQLVFIMLVEGMTLREVADYLGVAVATANMEKGGIADLLKTELQL
jgi:DNA-directed RNA polymerase specialized sigma24 family protein